MAEIIPVEPDLCNYNVGSMRQKFVSDCRAIRTENPLIHCITNYVAMSLNANALLAVGASPLMSFRREEMREVVAKSSALYVNLGCPDEALVDAAVEAVDAAAEYGRPWVLDPVGAGVSRLRTDTALRLIRRNSPAIIRGNASEIMALAGIGGKVRGVDSLESSEAALESARQLATEYRCVVVVSGETDYITNGGRVLTVKNGNPLMSRISGTGCTVSALCAAFAAVDRDSLCAAWNAMALMGVAGERAAARSAGLGSMQVALIDELSVFEPEEFADMIKGCEL